MQHVKCYNCNKFGNVARYCPEKKMSNSHEESGWGFTILCHEDGQSLVEKHFEMVSNNKVGFYLEQHSEVHLEQHSAVHDSEPHPGL